MIYIYIFLINQSTLMNYLMIIYIFGPIFYYSDILKNNFHYSIHNSKIHFYESLNKRKIIILYNSKKNNVFFFPYILK